MSTERHTHTPTPRALDSDELRALECALTAGLTPTIATVRRLIATVRDRDRTIRAQSERWQHAYETGQVAVNHDEPAQSGGRRA